MDLGKVVEMVIVKPSSVIVERRPTMLTTYRPQGRYRVLGPTGKFWHSVRTMRREITGGNREWSKSHF